METKSQRRKRHDDSLPSLNAAINALNRAGETISVKPVKDAFDSASLLLTTTRDSVINEADYVELGLACAGACQALDRVLKGRGAYQPVQSVLTAIERLKMSTAEIQRHIAKRGKRGVFSLPFHTKDNEGTITAWRSDFDEIRRIFETELAMDTDANSHKISYDASNARVSVPDLYHSISNMPQVSHDALDTRAGVSGIRYDRPIASEVQGDSAGCHTIASSIHHNSLKHQQERDDHNRPSHASAPGELSPPPQITIPGAASDIHREVVRTQAMVSEVRRDVVEIQQILKTREDDNNQIRAAQNSAFGESPPPSPRACFGRDELVERIVGLAENLNPIALIGAGGIGKTSIALTVLHHGRIKERFGDDRRFIRCDQFTASRANFLSRLSKVTGAGIENPDDLTPLWPHLSSKEMIIVLNNAESILDPHGADEREIYTVVEELTQFSNICLAITSRITAVPPDCRCLDIPALSIEAARKAFYHIYRNNEQPDEIDKILAHLDFHPLSVTLLATVAHQNKWDNNRLAKEWEHRQTSVLQTEHKKSLADTIELSLASPLFKNLGAEARDLLGVVAFFPQGISESNLDWLFPTTPNVTTTLDKFCILSLTYRSDGFVTMLMPLRDYLRPKDPLSSPLLSAIKESYFTRLSNFVDPDWPGFEESRWIVFEDANVEHLLDVLTSNDTISDDIWVKCAYFLSHLYWHKPRRTALGPKIETLSNDHRCKPRCLFWLARSFESVGNQTERKRLLSHFLTLRKEEGDDSQVALALTELSEANRLLRLHKEGIAQAEEALEIYERLNDASAHANCLFELAWLLRDDDQLDAAEEAGFRAIKLLPEKGEEYQACKSHRVLGLVFTSKGETEKAIHHFETALGIASTFNWNDQQFWIHHALAILFRNKDEFDNAHAHVERAKSYAIENKYYLGRAILLQARIYYPQRRFEDATSEALRASEILEKFGDFNSLEDCKALLQDIERTTTCQIASGTPDPGARA